MSVIAEYVTSLTQWQDVFTLAEALKEEGWAERIGYSTKQLEHFFVLTLAQPQFNGIVLVKDNDIPVHVTFLRALIGESENCQTEFQTHIVASYSRSKLLEAKSLRSQIVWTDSAWKLIKQWAKDRGHRAKHGILANVRLNASFKALKKRYGFDKLHVVIGANVDYT